MASKTKRKFGPPRDGALKEFYDLKTLYSEESGENFNGFSGSNELNDYPLRQLFFKKYKVFPNEWDGGYLYRDDVEKYISQNKKNVMTTHYINDGSNISSCLLSLGGSEKIYVYLYNRGNNKELDRYAICIFFTKKTKRVDNLIFEWHKLIIVDYVYNEPTLNILTLSPHGYNLQPKIITIPEIDFGLNYNADFEPINNLILERLSVNDSKGLVLLHGEPGTGKTTYIRYLVNKIKKRIIYIPPSLTNELSNPGLMTFLINNSNSILIIEDAENVITKRNQNSNQAIANILNMSDGLLSDCLNIQIVATFNADLSNVDDALIRKGRLIASYEFKQLEQERADALSKKLGVDLNNKTTLANIYNAQEILFERKRNTIGFKK